MDWKIDSSCSRSGGGGGPAVRMALPDLVSSQENPSEIVFAREAGTIDDFVADKVGDTPDEILHLKVLA